jgi:hypothetical protein
VGKNTRRISRQRLGKYIPAATNTKARIEVFWAITMEMVFSIRFTRVEAGSHTSTVTLRVVGGDEKGSLKFETVKIWSRVARDSDLRKTTLARATSYTKDRPVLSSERALHESKTVTVKE